ncbi:MAG: D-alanine--D-alanine ligase [Verrucomicrobiota bacterium]
MPQIFVLYGGVGPEREVSLRSGKSVLDCLGNREGVVGIEVTEASLPDGMNPKKGVVFPALHGEFGEDGKLQKLLEDADFDYVGSDSDSSSVCMDKALSKARAAEMGVPGAKGLVFSKSDIPTAREIVEKLGPRVVIKPVDSGSSAFLSIVNGLAELEECLSSLTERRWLFETYIEGRELSVGVLNGSAMGIVEIIPDGGVYDYTHKYTSGKTVYRAPAVLSSSEESSIRNSAEAVFTACGCRDFARVDFRLGESGPVFLEINSLPGLTSESLLPKSASCRGLSFEDLVLEMVSPALDRFQLRET